MAEVLLEIGGKASYNCLRSFLKEHVVPDKVVQGIVEDYRRVIRDGKNLPGRMQFFLQQAKKAAESTLSKDNIVESVWKWYLRGFDLERWYKKDVVKRQHKTLARNIALANEEYNKQLFLEVLKHYDNALPENGAWIGKPSSKLYLSFSVPGKPHLKPFGRSHECLTILKFSLYFVIIVYAFDRTRCAENLSGENAVMICVDEGGNTYGRPYNPTAVHDDDCKFFFRRSNFENGKENEYYINNGHNKFLNMKKK